MSKKRIELSKVEIGKILYSEEKIQERIRELGQQIVKDYQRADTALDHKQPLVLVGVLNGSIMFLSDLVKAISLSYSKTFGYDSGFVTWDAISISTRKENNEQKRSRWLLDTKMSLAGLDVLLVEDIVDSGKTARYVMNKLNDPQAKPRSLKLCTLLDRVCGNKHLIPDYTGFKLRTKEWILGYGMDTGGYFRNLSYIAVCKGC